MDHFGLINLELFHQEVNIKVNWEQMFVTFYSTVSLFAKRVANVAAAGFLSRYMNGPLPYV